VVVADEAVSEVATAEEIVVETGVAIEVVTVEATEVAIDSATLAVASTVVARAISHETALRSESPELADLVETATSVSSRDTLPAIVWPIRYSSSEYSFVANLN